MSFRRCWSSRRAASIRSASIVVAAFMALIASIGSTSSDALSSAGCNAVNAGAFNVSAGSLGSKTVVRFAIGDKITFTITWSNGGSWLLRTETFTNLEGSPIFATSGSQIRSYTVTGDNRDTALTQFTNDGTAVTATCTTAGPTPKVISISPASGPITGGTNVTITGTGFSGATSVHFGGNAASYTFDSDSSITVTSPAGSGTVDVTVTTSQATSATSSAAHYTYTAVPVAPAVTSALPVAPTTLVSPDTVSASFPPPEQIPLPKPRPRQHRRNNTEMLRQPQVPAQSSPVSRIFGPPPSTRP